MTSYKDNLLVRFAVISFMIMGIIAAGLFMLLTKGMVPEGVVDGIIQVHHIETMRRWVYTWTGVGFLVVYASLVIVVWFTSRRIKRQQGSLQEANIELQEAEERAEAANRAQSQFVRNLSHEMGAPMNGMLGMAELVLNTSLQDQQRRYIEKIHSSGEQLLTLLNDLLDSSKIETHQVQLKAIDFDLREILDGVTQIFANRTREKGLGFVSRINDNVPVFLRGDSGRLMQIVTHLMANAVKFTDEGKVALEVSAVEEIEDTVLLRFEVKDTGIGIDSGRQVHLFESFVQVDECTTRKHRGTGLGLAIVRRVSEQMGGRVGVQSEPGKGSTFWFTARLEKRSPTAQVQRNGGQTKMPVLEGNDEVVFSARVLLVDDNPINQAVGVDMLECLGCEIDVVGEGREAIAALSHESYDLVLMDCEMPEMDGFEATRIIRQRERQLNSRHAVRNGALLHVPIIAVTAHVLAYERQECERAGMDDYLTKPFSIDSLFVILRRWLPSPQHDESPTLPPASVSKDTIV